MDFDKFQNIVDELKGLNPIWFAIDSDPVGSNADIEEVENYFKIRLPEEYKKFIEVFGGGYFAFTLIFSLSETSDWNIIKQNQSLGLFENQHFLAVSDNQAGDYYGYKFENGMSEAKLYVYDHDNRQIRQTKYQNLYEYLLEVGLKQTI